ncbi:hypothetical protein PAXRUDRAFT_20801 [Paxillus rubicundulus Ve08.2h10]|uniref:Uncharacterized protein n=1 Tax=Paxillus rubicundulus Ve08.2h10 TaxID=930991 RepID=A0A0D0CD88_9AGAM|nr:hypothetical protein PAXRUDRAFT_20801 [Paxillus rubicundulus Ve08.2h10]
MVPVPAPPHLEKEKTCTAMVPSPHRHIWKRRIKWCGSSGDRDSFHSGNWETYGGAKNN